MRNWDHMQQRNQTFNQTFCLGPTYKITTRFPTLVLFFTTPFLQINGLYFFPIGKKKKKSGSLNFKINSEENVLYIRHMYNIHIKMIERVGGSRLCRI